MKGFNTHIVNGCCISTMELYHNFFFVIGILWTFWFIFKLLNALWSAFRTFIWSRICGDVDFRTVHGPWAVITGSTDGIGKEFARQLAKRGMNIVLISRNELKLKKTAEEIRNECDVTVNWIQADFTSTGVYDKIREGLGKIDVGILINNVGMSNRYSEEIITQTETFLTNIVNVNILSTVINTSIVLPKMKAKNRGMIVNVSSITGSFPVILIAMYSSTKALAIELKDCNVTVKGLKAGPVKTAMLPPGFASFLDKYVPFICPTAETYVKSALATLNTNVLFTCGYWGHSLCHLYLHAIGGRNRDYIVRLFEKMFSDSKEDKNSA